MAKQDFPPMIAGEKLRVQTELGSYWIVADEHGFPKAVYLNRCLHLGAELLPSKTGFRCPAHGWTYDDAGRCIDNPHLNLEEIAFEIEGDRVQVKEPSREPVMEATDALDGTETLRLLAHASFMLTSGDRRLLFDPWLVGDAYWGSWRHFPEHQIDISGLHPTEIIVTHPHPDHFHVETLKCLSRDVPIFFPNFPSAIIPKTLEQLGFKNLRPTSWENPIHLGAGIEFSFLRPISQWEDSAVLVRVKNWFWLNQNDAGVSMRDELLPERIDLLTAAFDAGASGYPATWEMSPARKVAILEEARVQVLNLIASRCQQVRAKAFAPFAGWWRHALDIHNGYASLIAHTSLQDVEQILQGTETRAIPTIPSSVISLLSMSHSFDDSTFKSLTKDPRTSNFVAPDSSLGEEDLSHRLAEGLAKLQSLSFAVKCERVDFRVLVGDSTFDKTFSFGNLNEQLVTTITARIPRWVAELLVQGNPTVTWNHISIGYWVTWSRSPNSHPYKFMRLLQLGVAPGFQSSRSSWDSLAGLAERPLTDFIEANPSLSRAVMERAGLPCHSCSHASSESLEDALLMHEVPKARRIQLMHELAAIADEETI